MLFEGKTLAKAQLKQLRLLLTATYAKHAAFGTRSFICNQSYTSSMSEADWTANSSDSRFADYYVNT